MISSYVKILNYIQAIGLSSANSNIQHQQTFKTRHGGTESLNLRQVLPCPILHKIAAADNSKCESNNSNITLHLCCDTNC